MQLGAGRARIPERARIRQTFDRAEGCYAEKMMSLIPIPRSGRFTVILASIVAVTITGITVLLLWQLRANELSHSRSETVRLSHVIADQTVRSLQSATLALDIALDRLAQAKGLGVSIDDFGIHAMLVSRIEGLPQLRSMFLVNANGDIASSALSHPSPKFSVKDRDYFAIHRERPDLDVYVSAPTKNRLDGKWTLFLSKRIPTPDGRFGGVIAASMDIAYVQSLYDSIRTVGISPISLHLHDGTLIARAPQEEAKLGEKAILPVLSGRVGEQAGFVTIRTPGEDSGVTTYHGITGFPLILLVGSRDRDALAEWRGTAALILAAAVTNIILVFLAAAFLLRRQQNEANLERRARDSGDQLRALVNSAMDAIVTVDSNFHVAVFNPAAQRMFGYSEEQVSGKSLDRLLPERFRLKHAKNLRAFGSSGVSARMKEAHMDITGLRADGTEFPVESSIAQMTIDGKAMFTAILRDVGERHRAESELRESHRQLRELASSLQAVREEERTSIARELHDELGQQLLRLRMDLSWLSGRIKDLAPALQDKVAEMKNFVAGIVDALRHVTTRLRPPLLDDLGLTEAARWQLEDFSRQAGIDVSASIAIDDAALDERMAINLFRILQESLTNVARHAGATRVDITLTMNEDGLLLEVSDNGSGATFGNHPEMGHGLVGIRERTLMLGGQMDIVTEPGRGFSLRIRIPLIAPEMAGG